MIYLAADHAGFELKNKIKKLLDELRLDYKDIGPNNFDAEDDYPDFIIPVAKKVALSKKNKGIIFGGSGQGEAIVANKIKGIRATVYYGGPIDIVRLSRKHNDANILSLGSRFLKEDEAKKAVKIWLEEEFDADRHQRRIDKIKKVEEK